MSRWDRIVRAAREHDAAGVEAVDYLAALCDEHDRADDERAGAPGADIYTSGAISTVTSAARCASCGRTPVRGAALRALDALSRLRDRAYARQLPTCYG